MARVWRLAFGVWRLAFGVWRLAFGVRRSCSCSTVVAPRFALPPAQSRPRQRGSAPQEGRRRSREDEDEKLTALLGRGRVRRRQKAVGRIDRP